MSNQTPDDFAQIGSDEEVDSALKPKKTLNLPLATAILAGIVVLAIGLAGGAGLHAAFASNSTSNQPQATGRGAGGYGGFRGQNGGGTGTGTGQGQGQFPGGGGTTGTVVSATSTELVVKTQAGNVTVKLTGDTTYEITKQGTAADLKAGEQVVVTGQTANGTVTANSVRQGAAGGGFRNPSATPSSR
jgi:RNase P/RNase MRP subunit p29